MKAVSEWARDRGLDDGAIAELLRVIGGGGDGTWNDDDPDEVRRDRAIFGPRYEDRGPLGLGSTAEVRRVFDRVLERNVAMKIVREDQAQRGVIVDRFLREARASAVLQHAGVAPVYDYGALPDGRPYITMREVTGTTLRAAIDVLHAATAEAWGSGLRRVLEIVVRACETVAYAHANGMCHLDLKPHNVMIGEHGDVLVVDWGLARATDEPTGRAMIAGTPSYMPPEQAVGRIVDFRRADVYALGATLYHVLSGATTYGRGDAATILDCVRRGPPDPLPVDSLGTGDGRGAERALPVDLVAIVERAMSRDPAGRYADASGLALALAGWLAGESRRDRALTTVRDALAHLPAAVDLRERAALLRADAARRLAAVPGWAPEDEKADAWAAEDEADNLDRQADAEGSYADRELRAALQLHSDLPDAHAALARRSREEHARAERIGDSPAARRAETALSEHVSYLPYESPERADAVAYLRGHGRLRVASSPAGVVVRWYRYETVRRRLVAREVKSVGRTPLDVELPLGRHLLVFDGPGGPVRYPLIVGRTAPWSFTPPGADSPVPIVLPGPGALGEDDCYVPAGWCDVGDAAIAEALPPGRAWVDGFAMRRYPVTNREYLAFLDDRMAHGADPMAYVPRERGAAGTEGAPIFGIVDGRFAAVADSDGDAWDLDWPVMAIDRAAALAYAAWYARQTGLPWRLPGDLEWEKAARGPDRRRYPWGDFYDPSWACTHDSHRGRPLPARVTAFPVDESPYGVRGMAGNARDWCADGYRRDGVVRPDDPIARAVVRGGSWTGFATFARAAVRYPLDPSYRLPNLGFRLVRSVG